MNPKDIMEIQMQVKEPISKGLVRMSLSPYVVPIHLLPKKDGLMRMFVDNWSINKVTNQT